MPDSRAKAKEEANARLALVPYILLHKNMAGLNATHRLMVDAGRLLDGENAGLNVVHYNIYLPSK